MIFRRRVEPTLGEKIRGALWPRGGWSRALRYFAKRILRLSGSPHDISVGFAAGIFIGWSPLFGFHYLMAVALAFLLRGNVLASVLSTTIANPLTLPAMWALDYKVGSFLDGRIHHGHGTIGVGHAMTEKSIEKLLPIFEPLLVGWLALGLVSGIVSYLIVGYAVRSFKAARRERLEARRLDRSGEPAGGRMAS